MAKKWLFLGGQKWVQKWKKSGFLAKKWVFLAKKLKKWPKNFIENSSKFWVKNSNF